VTRATILNLAKTRVKNDTTVMVSNMHNRHKLHGQMRNKRNIREIKRVRIKSAMSSNKKAIHQQSERLDGDKKDA
jgi:hypothetical protein